MSVPQQRATHDLAHRRRQVVPSLEPVLKQVEAPAPVRRRKRRGTMHRLTWFEAVQGVSLLAFIMFLGTYGTIAGFIVCIGIGTCVPAIVAACCGGDRKPLHLAASILWVFAGAIYLFVSSG